jgi:hypothetical protein
MDDITPPVTNTKDAMKTRGIGRVCADNAPRNMAASRSDATMDYWNAQTDRAPDGSKNDTITPKWSDALEKLRLIYTDLIDCIYYK